MVGPDALDRIEQGVEQLAQMAGGLERMCAAARGLCQRMASAGDSSWLAPLHQYGQRLHDIVASAPPPGGGGAHSSVAAHSLWDPHPFEHCGRTMRFGRIGGGAEHSFPQTSVSDPQSQIRRAEL